MTELEQINQKIAFFEQQLKALRRRKLELELVEEDNRKEAEKEARLNRIRHGEEAPDDREAHDKIMFRGGKRERRALRDPSGYEKSRDMSDAPHSESDSWSNSNCQVCNKVNVPLYQCSACNDGKYCGSKCQMAGCGEKH